MWLVKMSAVNLWFFVLLSLLNFYVAPTSAKKLMLSVNTKQTDGGSWQYCRISRKLL
jgi:hypothetical protein